MGAWLKSPGLPVGLLASIQLVGNQEAVVALQLLVKHISCKRWEFLCLSFFTKRIMLLF